MQRASKIEHFQLKVGILTHLAKPWNALMINTHAKKTLQNASINCRRVGLLGGGSNRREDLVVANSKFKQPVQGFIPYPRLESRIRKRHYLPTD